MRMKLYHRWNSPESAEVRDFIETNNLESQFDYLDIEDDVKNRFDLKKIDRVDPPRYRGRPPSEPYVRVSRIRLFKWELFHSILGIASYHRG